MKNVKKCITAILVVISLFFINGCTIIKGDASGEKDIVNSVAENKIMTANLAIISSNKFNVPSATGSGVVYLKESYGGSNYYYVITNNHVVYNLSYFEIRDSYGDIYNATLLASDSAYDLAVLKFKSEKSYYIPKFVQDDLGVNEKVICLGEPNGILNTITLGKVVKYTKVNVDGGSLSLDNGGSLVEFDVMEHDAPINHGSSGGVVLDYNFNIVAINFAASRDGDSDKFLSAYAIPSLKVIEFLIANELG